MNKKKKKIIRYSIILGVLVILCAVVAMIFSSSDVGAEQFAVENSDLMSFNPFLSTEARLDNSLLEYGKVLTKYSQRGYTNYTGDKIAVDLKTVTGTDGNGELVYFKDSELNDSQGGLKYYDSAEGVDKYVDVSAYPDAFYASDATTTVTFVIDVPADGLYSLNLDYLMIKNKDTDMYVSLMIDGKLPFKNATNMAIKRMYGFYNTDLENNTDIAGNQIRPKQQELFGWQSTTLTSTDGTYRDPYRFYMAAGQRTITMTFYNQPGVIGGISFIAPLVTPSYDEYVAANGGISSTYTGDVQRIEMEVPDYTSSVSLRMEYDNDYASSPQSYKVIRYNVFGGARWGNGGDTVEWTFSVPETGWYQVGFRYMSINTYIAAYKDIAIDGTIPFREMSEYCFPYSDTWSGESLKNAEQDPYMFYLTEGDHTITITNKVGPLRHVYQSLDEAMTSVSTLVTQVAKITASTRNESGGYVVDKNRDWDLQKNLPDLQEDLEAYVEVFEQCYQKILDANNSRLPSYGSAVQVAVELFEKMAEDMEEVPVSLNDINNALTGLSNTMVSLKDQSITVDYMVLSAQGYDYADSHSSTLQSTYVGFVRFFDTFTKDYSAVGTRQESPEDMKSIEVYVSRGREYVDILRNMVAEQFTPEYGVKVNINMVAGASEGLIMPRYVAGTAPDLAISIGVGTPFEFAVRGALMPLDQFESYTLENGTQVLGFEDLKNQSYYDAAFTPFLFQDHYYGFPETQSWVALFYRTDIFEQLDLTPPDTWEDVYNLVPALTKEGYSFYYPYGVGNYTPFLFQHGGDFYDEHGLTSALTSNAAYDAFIEYADLYLQYNFIYAADFYMRFKSGEMPVGIGDMGFYSKLKFSAPELNGKWEILPIPGHTVTNAAGEVVVDRSSGGIASCNVIISDTDNPDESWQFIQWWSSDAVQAEYGREVEATFGVASRWNPANKNAVETLPYTQSELDVIYSQWEWLREAPNVLGGYYTSRYLVTALNQTVLQGLNARIALEDAIKIINDEMERKQEEYGIDADNGGSVLHASSNNQ